MSSQSSYEFYGADLSKMPPLRAIAETLILDSRVRAVTAAEAYELACAQPDVSLTDMPVYPPAAKRLGLPDHFIDHGDQNLLLAELGLDVDGIVRQVRQRLPA